MMMVDLMVDSMAERREIRVMNLCPCIGYDVIS